MLVLAGFGKRTKTWRTKLDPFTITFGLGETGALGVTWPPRTPQPSVGNVPGAQEVGSAPRSVPARSKWLLDHASEHFCVVLRYRISLRVVSVQKLSQATFAQNAFKARIGTSICNRHGPGSI
jgi:hypothetical protein